MSVKYGCCCVIAAICKNEYIVIWVAIASWTCMDDWSALKMFWGYKSSWKPLVMENYQGCSILRRTYHANKDLVQSSGTDGDDSNSNFIGSFVRNFNIGYHHKYEVIKHDPFLTILPTIGSIRLACCCNRMRRQKWAVWSLYRVAKPRGWGTALPRTRSWNFLLSSCRPIASDLVKRCAGGVHRVSAGCHAHNNV